MVEATASPREHGRVRLDKDQSLSGPVPPHPPETRNQILISRNLDQEYNHTVVVRSAGPVEGSEINALLDLLEQSGDLDRLRERYSLY